MTRLAVVSYLVSIALLPWGRWLSIPALHEHAQWSDVAVAVAFAAWVAAALRGGRRPRWRPYHAPLLGYVAWAALSHAAAGFEPRAGSYKLLGQAELAVLVVLTADVASTCTGRRWLVRVVAGTSLLTALVATVESAAALTGHPLWPPAYGDLLPGVYTRAQAGMPHRNLLASFTIFASGIVALPDGALGRRRQRGLQIALAVTCALTLSREVLGFGLAWLVRRADTAGRRRLALVAAGTFAALLMALSATNLAVDPTHPTEVRRIATPSVRSQTVATALDTLRAHPWFGSGPGHAPARIDRSRYDAHLTPLNVAATLGLPALGFLAAVVWLLFRGRPRPTDRVVWGMLAGLALGGLAQDIEDFRHVWVALGLAAADQPEAESGTSEAC